MRFCVSAFLRFCLIAFALSPDVRATDWYVDVNTGSNSNTGLSPVRPFKTITYGLLACSAGDRIFVAPGTYAYVSGAADTESFPLTTHKNNITIQGRGSPKPVITAAGYPSSSWLTNLAITIQPRDGWTLKDLRIDNSGYDKISGSTYGHPFHAIHGVHVLDLDTSFTAVGLELFDNFWGIWIEDQSGISHASVRTVTIDGCLFEEQGPTISPSLAVTDIGHAGLMIGGETTLQASVLNCTFKDNHDGLEGGQAGYFGNPTKNRAAITVTDSLFENNENGLECQDSVLTVADCVLRDNQRLKPSLGGVSNAYTIAMGNRSASSNVRYTVRRTLFEDNQMAVGLFGSQTVITGSPTNPIVFDFGTSSSDLGANTFVTDITYPWYATETEHPSYCGLWTNHPNPVFAVGNTWTYDVSGVGVPDLNQGCNSSGLFPLPGTSLSLAPGENVVSGTDVPPSRPLTTALPNVPWNFGVGFWRNPTTGTIQAPSVAGGPLIVVIP